ncbi:hypothetical protein [Lutibacter sp.]|uniref:hypothetical protein n=1 Tax=Lutibacter sp. TaxID=1925666 RepID=UPI00273461D3|nr:hypothetical protein [Lutibacter sp.]MDP3314284.1 hypothetical protein [Lutibacter sp.]
MKNLLIILVLAFSLMSFSSTNNTESELVITSSIQFENLGGDDAPCRWRVCTYRNGMLVGCTEWVYTDCAPVVWV